MAMLFLVQLLPNCLYDLVQFFLGQPLPFDFFTDCAGSFTETAQSLLMVLIGVVEFLHWIWHG